MRINEFADMSRNHEDGDLGEPNPKRRQIADAGMHCIF